MHRISGFFIQCFYDDYYYYYCDYDNCYEEPQNGIGNYFDWGVGCRAEGSGCRVQGLGLSGRGFKEGVVDIARYEKSERKHTFWES